MAIHVSSKHLQIDKAKSTVAVIIAVTSIVTIFCLVSSKALLSQAAYQRKVLHQRRQAVSQLRTDATQANQLVDNYKQIFQGNNPANIIGGKNTTDPNAIPPDGDNSRVVLDALPTKYDFPALITSVANILTKDGIASPSIGGSDQSTSIDSKPSAKPQPTVIQISIGGNSSYKGVQTLIADLERSIRPFDVTSVQIAGSGSQISISLAVNTYFQPAKEFNTGTETIR